MVIADVAKLPTLDIRKRSPYGLCYKLLSDLRPPTSGR